MVRVMHFGTSFLLVALTGNAAVRENVAGNSSVQGPHTRCVSATVPDHGAATTSEKRLSVRDCVDSIGAARGTLVFRHDSVGQTTDYVFETGTAVPENITLVFENGARLRISEGATVTINGGIEAAPGQQIFSGDGKVTGSPKVTEIHPEWWTENAEPGKTDMRHALQAAFDLAGTSAASCRKIVLIGDYSITDQIRWASGDYPHGIQLEGRGSPVAFHARIVWNGPPDPDKAVVVLDQSSTRCIVRDVQLHANGRAGFAFRIKGADPEVRVINVPSWVFSNTVFRRATVAGFAAGPYPAPHRRLGASHAYDCNTERTTFQDCDFTENPIGVVIDAHNAQVMRFINCGFVWWAAPTQDILRNGIYQRRGSDTLVIGAFGAPMLREELPDVALFRVDEGNFTVLGGYAEDGRLLRGSSGGYKGNVKISDFHANGYGEYSVYATGSGRISLEDCALSGWASSTKVSVTGPLFARNVRLTALGPAESRGLYELTNPDLCVIEGVVPGTMNSLTRNALFARWESAGEPPEDDDVPLDWTKYVGRGGTATLKMSKKHAYWGGLAAEITCQEAPSTYVSGVEQRIVISNQVKWVTAIMTGTAPSPKTFPRAYINGGGTTYTVRPTPNRFVTITEKDVSGDGDGRAILRAGISGGETGVIYVDTLSVFPRRFLDTATAAALFLPAPEPIPAAHYGSGSPTVGTWSRGDVVWCRQPAGGEAPGWICTEAGQPGVWKSMASLGP